jgi:putative SOS response-associated peptidase YedK
MYGQLTIIDDPITQAISRLLGIQFTPETNNVRPSQKVSVLDRNAHAIRQHEMCWGITPHGSEKVMFHTRAETLPGHPSFHQAFSSCRVIVPCCGWYEWSDKEGEDQVYRISSPDEEPLYLAGIGLENRQKLVTLSTCADKQYSHYHYCMPLLLDEETLEQWLTGNCDEAGELLTTKARCQVRANKVKNINM